MNTTVSKNEDLIQKANKQLIGRQFTLAAKMYRDVLSNDASDPRALHGLALVAAELGALNQSIRLLESAQALSTDPEVLRNLGMIRLRAGFKTEALDAFQQASMYSPTVDNFEAVLTGQIHCHLYEKIPDTVSLLRAIDKNSVFAYYAEAVAYSALCDIKKAEQSRSALIGSLANPQNYPELQKLSVFYSLMLGFPADLQRRLLSIAQKKYIQGKKISELYSSTQTHSKIRIGYLSADLCDHAVGFQILPMLQQHDRDKFSVYGLRLRAADDETSSKIDGVLDGSFCLAELDDRSAAEFIASMELDVLIDLGGWTDSARPGILGHRPCGLQLHYLGYPGSVGTGLVDGVFGHSVRDPVSTHVYYEEPIVELSHYVGTGGWAINHVPKRADYGLAEDALVFGYFSASYRINYELFSAWSTIMKVLPHAVLLLPAYGDVKESNIKRAARDFGWDCNRIYFIKNARLSSHWPHILADLWLDAFRPSAGTAGAIGAWAGVPILTRAGISPQERTGAMMAHLAGMDELICDSTEAYIYKAIQLGRNREKLSSLRSKLLQRDSLLFQPKAATRRLESILVYLINMCKKIKY